MKAAVPVLLGLAALSVAPPTRTRVNPEGAFIEYRGAETVVDGTFVNRGHIKTTDTVVRFTGPYFEHGHYESDPSSNYFTDWIVGPAGRVTAGAGDRFIVSGDFINGSLQNATWTTGLSDLLFNGGGTHTMALPGVNGGATFDGYVANFAWKSLRLAAGQGLVLTDGNATPGAALYVDQLLLDGGLPQIASVTGNGFTIFYNSCDPANAWLAGASYPLAGGGSITPVVPDLRVTSTTVLPGGTQRVQFLGAALRVHRVQASTDLLTFTTLTTATAAADGSFTCDDPAAATTPRRFYRALYP